MAKTGKLKQNLEVFEKQAALRVVHLRLDSSEHKSDLTYASPEESRGMRICKDAYGSLYLIRQSSDGWVTSYFLCDNDGPLFATPLSARKRPSDKNKLRA